MPGDETKEQLKGEADNYLFHPLLTSGQSPSSEASPAPEQKAKSSTCVLFCFVLFLPRGQELKKAKNTKSNKPQ